MSHRLIASVFVAVLSTALCHAEPFRWGWTLTSPTGAVLGSASGLEVTDVNFGLLAAPVLTPGPATRDDPSYFPNLHVKSATSTATLTLTDEVTNLSDSVEVFWTKYESWLLFTDDDGSTSAEVQDSWDQSGPNQPGARRWVGNLKFRIEQFDGNTAIVAAPADVPEPGTLILGGVGLAGGVGAWLKRRRK